MKHYKENIFVFLAAVMLFGCTKSEEVDFIYVETTSSSVWAQQLACLATDADPSSFWLPKTEEESCLLVDLRGVQYIGQISFDWYPAKNCAYAVDVTEDGVEWRTILTGEVEEVRVSQVVLEDPVRARCLMLRQRGDQKGLSELRLNGQRLMDQTAPAYQSLLWKQRECGQNADMNHHLRLPACGDHEKAAQHQATTLQNSTDFECVRIRENDAFTGISEN